MKKEVLNIYDIAEIANVSIATVSRVVNGSDKVSENTRKKVLKVIEDVGYTPNVFAQGLGLNTMHTVGILVPTLADDYMSTAIDCLEKELKRYGYDCILSCTGFEQAADMAETGRNAGETGFGPNEKKRWSAAGSRGKNIRKRRTS